MLIHGSRLFRTFAEHHKNALLLIGGSSILRFPTNLIYTVLTVMLVAKFGETGAGAYLAFYTILQILLFDPLGGNLADSIGSKRTMQISGVGFLLSGLIILWFGFSPISLVLLGLPLFVGYSLRVHETYLLRTTPKREGGLIFGLTDDVIAITSFLASLSLAFFISAENHQLLALATIAGVSFWLMSLALLPTDIPKVTKVNWHKIFNTWQIIQHGLHFVTRNGRVPLLSVGYRIFIGFFMSTIWFVIPLQIAKLGGGAQAGLGLGIYELVTIFFAGMAGFLADTYNWRLSNTLGWILIAGGGIALAAFPTLTGLIISGSVIAIGNNLAHYASAHALETYDKDHREDGSFMAFGNMLENLGWGFSPLLVGYLYAKFGFDTSLLFCTAIAILSALVMIPLTWQVKHKCSAKLKLKC